MISLCRVMSSPNVATRANGSILGQRIRSQHDNNQNHTSQELDSQLLSNSSVLSSRMVFRNLHLPFSPSSTFSAMPVKINTGTKLGLILQEIGFLATAPYADVERLEPHQGTCSICLENFTNNGSWIAGETLNCPVKLRCGRE